MLELIYTSTKAGLQMGRSGFASVAWTRGIPTNLIEPLESLSGYKPVFAPNDENSKNNPVAYSYLQLKYGNYYFKVMSRVAYAGLDYTGRSNKIAHHIVLENMDELLSLPLGPVSAFLDSQNFVTQWNKPAEVLPAKTRLLSPLSPASLVAKNWLRITGDAGWAGVIAERFMNYIRDKKNSTISNSLYLEFDISMNTDVIIALIAEVAALLPREYLSDFTFSTYFLKPHNNADCFLRATLTNTPSLNAIKNLKPNDIISLITKSEIPSEFEASPLVLIARTGLTKPQSVAQCVIHQKSTATSQVNISKIEEFGDIKLKDLSTKSNVSLSKISAIELKKLEIEHQKTLNASTKNQKKIMLTLGIFLLLSLGGLVILLMNYNSSFVPNTQVEVVHRPPIVRVPKEVPIVELPKKEVETPIVVVEVKEPISDVVAPPLTKVLEKKIEVPELIITKMNNAEQFNLFTNIMQSLNNKELDFGLPQDWEVCSKVTAKMEPHSHYVIKNLSNNEIELQDKSGTKYFSLKVLDNNQVVITRQLAFKNSSNDKKCTIFNSIGELIFESANHQYIMNFGFVESYLEYLAPKIEVNKDYDILISENNFSNIGDSIRFFVAKGQNSFPRNLKFLIDNYNRTLLEKNQKNKELERAKENFDKQRIGKKIVTIDELTRRESKVKNARVNKEELIKDVATDQLSVYDDIMSSCYLWSRDELKSLITTVNKVSTTLINNIWATNSKGTLNDSLSKLQARLAYFVEECPGEKCTNPGKCIWDYYDKLKELNRELIKAQKAFDSATQRLKNEQTLLEKEANKIQIYSSFVPYIKADKEIPFNDEKIIDTIQKQVQKQSFFKLINVKK